jgi:hypothetical protein
VDEHAANYIERILALGEPDEVKLLDAILTGGYDQGCFLRPNDDDLLPASDPATVSAVFAALTARELAPSPSADDPFEHDALTAQMLTEDAPGFIVLTQRCDLVRSLKVEPFVELVAVELVRDTNAVSVAKRNSPRSIFIADHPEGAWVADLRCRAVLAKDRLSAYAPLQLVETGEPHKRLKLRVGQRYSRDALPTDLVERLQRPLVKLLRKPSQMKKVEPFSEFIVFRNGDQVEIVAVYPTTVDRKTADDAWDELEEAMPQELVDLIHEPSSGALSVTELSFFRYFGGWKLDLDEVTYQGKASPDQAAPHL